MSKSVELIFNKTEGKFKIKTNQKLEQISILFHLTDDGKNIDEKKKTAQILFNLSYFNGAVYMMGQGLGVVIDIEQVEFNSGKEKEIFTVTENKTLIEYIEVTGITPDINLNTDLTVVGDIVEKDGTYTPAESAPPEIIKDKKYMVVYEKNKKKDIKEDNGARKYKEDDNDEILLALEFEEFPDDDYAEAKKKLEKDPNTEDMDVAEIKEVYPEDPMPDFAKIPQNYDELMKEIKKRSSFNTHFKDKEIIIKKVTLEADQATTIDEKEKNVIKIVKIGDKVTKENFNVLEPNFDDKITLLVEDAPKKEAEPEAEAEPEPTTEPKEETKEEKIINLTLKYDDSEEVLSFDLSQNYEELITEIKKKFNINNYINISVYKGGTRIKNNNYRQQLKNEDNLTINLKFYDAIPGKGPGQGQDPNKQTFYKATPQEEFHPEQSAEGPLIPEQTLQPQQPTSYPRNYFGDETSVEHNNLSGSSPLANTKLKVLYDTPPGDFKDDVDKIKEAFTRYGLTLKEIGINERYGDEDNIFSIQVESKNIGYNDIAKKYGKIAVQSQGGFQNYIYQISSVEDNDKIFKLLFKKQGEVYQQQPKKQQQEQHQEPQPQPQQQQQQQQQEQLETKSNFQKGDKVMAVHAQAPTADDELTLEKGNILTIVKQTGEVEEGWLKGKKEECGKPLFPSQPATPCIDEGGVGIFPASYVQLYDDKEEDEEED